MSPMMSNACTRPGYPVQSASLFDRGTQSILVADAGRSREDDGMDNAQLRRRLANQWDTAFDLEAVRVFAAVAELRSFRGAAAALRVPRSTVSRRLAALEETLDTRLLQRTTRHVSLTEAGDAFLAQVSPALATIADAGRTVLDAGALPRGLVRVTASASMGERIAAVMLELRERYPEIRLELEFTDRQVDLIAEGFDLAIRAGVLADSSLIARPLGRGTAGYFASPAYLARHGKPKVPRDLLAHDCIVFTGTTRGSRWRFQHGRKSEELTVPRKVVANQLVVVRLAAMRGHGIAWMPESIARDAVARGTLAPVLQKFWEPRVLLHLVYPSARHLAPQVRAAIEVLLECVPLT
jgi:DNA-binding transcriptional LysR family regulator